MAIKRTPRPPRLAQRLLSWASRSENDFGILGDYEEEFSVHRAQQGKRRARQWYWQQTLRSAVPLIFNRWLWGIHMFRHHMTTTLRSMIRSKGPSILQLLGLTLGLACALIIILYVRFENSYDNYHPDLDRIYRVAAHWQTSQNDYWTVATSAPVTKTLQDNYPQVEKTARVLTMNSTMIRHEDKAFYETRLAFADHALLDILGLPLLHGDAGTALLRPDAVVISRSIAMKYFGRLDVVGETLALNNREFQISGVMEDIPRNSHLKLNILLSISRLNEMGYPMSVWFIANMYSYVKLVPNTDIEAFNTLISGLGKTYAPAESFDPGQEVAYALQPVKDIHLKSHCDSEVEPPTRPITLVLALLIGFFVLSIAMMNYITLCTARAVKRAREVGIRKTIGARRGQIILQFILETGVTLLIAMGLALTLIFILLPQINQMAGLNLNTTDFQHASFWGILLALFFLASMAGSLYPAFFLSAFHPIKTLKTGFQVSRSGNGIRRTLVLLQFILSTMLIIGTLVIHRQIHYMKHRSPGFQRQHQLIVPYRQRQRLRTEPELVKAEYLRHPGVLAAAASNAVPGEMLNRWDTRLTGDDNFSFVLNYLNVDPDFFNTYDLKLMAGRPFDKSRNSEINTCVLLNKTAVMRLGFTPETAIGHELLFSETPYLITGVIEDFHQKGLQAEIEPIGLVWQPESFNRLTLTISDAEIPQTIARVKALWEQDNPLYPFEYFFLDQAFNSQYQNEERTARLFTATTLVGIIVACLGLIALAAFIAERRTKEIGIRKVLGAGAFQLVAMMTKDFLILVVSANLLAIPLSIWGAGKWLEGFAYKTSLSLWIPLLALTLVLCLAGLTVGLQSFKAATVNPVKSLKCE